MILVTMKMNKDTKYGEATQCMKEGVHRASQLIENWTGESSISGVTEINGMPRREYFGEVEK